MFKGILNPKRVSYSDFTMVTGPVEPVNGKENHPAATPVENIVSKQTRKKTTAKQRKASHGKLAEGVEMDQDFDKLLDDLQIPEILRPKLEKMESSVKAAMIKSSQLAFRGPSSPPSLRRSHSTDSIDSAKSHTLVPGPEYPRVPERTGRGIGMRVGSASIPRSPSAHVRGASVDIFQTMSRGQSSNIVPTQASHAKSLKEKGTTLSPAIISGMLANTPSTELEIDFIKRLRLYLRNESASWSQGFLRAGGYTALLTRLNDILEVEWREEQHDDQVLHELLRCFKALSTSSIGCFALRSSCPTPFVQLVSLIYSDKRPGDIATRQMITELLLMLFDLYPPSSLPAIGSSNVAACHSEAWEKEDSRPSTSALVTLPAPHKTLFALIRALLLTPAPPPTESPSNPVSPHAFIESLHQPRIYKTYLQELSDICRDYFWVFCHLEHGFWNLEDTDEAKVEKPRAPSGMTGGVEFEAMNYMTTHFRLINALAKAAADLNLPKDHDHSAHRFHADLFLSGVERILLMARRASMTYYPTLHLEMARFISFCGRAGYEVPWSISREIGPPPSAVCKPGRARSARSPPSSPSKKKSKPAGPLLPTPKKIDPIRLDH